MAENRGCEGKIAKKITYFEILYTFFSKKIDADD